MLQAAKEQGYRDAYTLANALKPGSRKTHDRLGWRLSGRVLRIETAGGWLRPVRLTGSPHPLSRTKPPSATAP